MMAATMTSPPSLTSSLPPMTSSLPPLTSLPPGAREYLVPRELGNLSLSSNASEHVLSCDMAPVYHPDLTQLPWVTVLVAVAYCVIILLAVVGNGLVIWTVWRNAHMHTVTNYYIVNLAGSDLLVAGLVMPLKLLEYAAPCHWGVFSAAALCAVLAYLLPIFVFTSVLTLVAISLER